MTHKAKVTNVGINELANASENGFRLSFPTFVVTESLTITADVVDGSALEPTAPITYQSEIALCEVLNPNTVKFTLNIEGELPVEGEWVITEGMIYTETGAAGVHIFFDPPIRKDKSYDASVEVFVTHARLGEVINIVNSNYSSIASVGQVKLMPRPDTSQQNTLSVLNGQLHPDRSYGPLMAMRYGPGGEFWGFTGHDRIYYGRVDNVVNVVTDDGDLKVDTLILNPDAQGFYVKPGDVLLVHAVVGPGMGQTRKMRFMGDDTFVEIESMPFDDVNTLTTFAFWKNMSQEVNSIGALLRPQFTNFIITADGVNKDFTLPYSVKSADYCWVFVRGAKEMSFGLNGKVLSLSKIYPKGYLIDVVLLRMIPDPDNMGTVLRLRQFTFEGDGETRKFTLPFAPRSINNVFLYRGAVHQQRLETYKLSGRDVVMNVPPEIACPITIDVFEEVTQKNSNAVIVLHRVFNTTSPNIVLYSGETSLGEVMVFDTSVHQRQVSFAKNTHGIVLSQTPKATDSFLIYEVRIDPMYKNLQRPYVSCTFANGKLRFVRQDGSVDFVDLSACCSGNSGGSNVGGGNTGGGNTGGGNTADQFDSIIPPTAPLRSGVVRPNSLERCFSSDDIAVTNAQLAGGYFFIGVKLGSAAAGGAITGEIETVESPQADNSIFSPGNWPGLRLAFSPSGLKHDSDHYIEFPMTVNGTQRTLAKGLYRMLFKVKLDGTNTSTIPIVFEVTDGSGGGGGGGSEVDEPGNDFSMIVFNGTTAGSGLNYSQSFDCDNSDAHSFTVIGGKMAQFQFKGIMQAKKVEVVASGGLAAADKLVMEGDYTNQFIGQAQELDPNASTSMIQRVMPTQVGEYQYTARWIATADDSVLRTVTFNVSVTA